jgi:hypothetical protein
MALNIYLAHRAQVYRKQIASATRAYKALDLAQNIRMDYFSLIMSRRKQRTGDSAK